MSYKANCLLLQYPMDKNKGSKIPAQIRVNMWLGLVAVEKKFNAYAEGTFTVFAELVNPFIFTLYISSTQSRSLFSCWRNDRLGKKYFFFLTV